MATLGDRPLQGWTYVPPDEAHRWIRVRTEWTRTNGTPMRVSTVVIARTSMLRRMHHIERIQKRRDALAGVDLGGEG